MKTQIYNLKGEAVGDIELSDKIFAREWNADLVHQALVSQQANRRLPWAHSKNRAEVSGGGKKPWKQKHTGRARHGSIRSPIWRGGGVTHGPVVERDYSKKINKKMLRVAIHSVLSKKLADGQLKILDSMEVAAPKTKLMFNAVKNFLPALLVAATKNVKLVNRVSRNIPKAKSLNGPSLNVEDLLKFKNVLVEKNAVEEIK